MACQLSLSYAFNGGHANSERNKVSVQLSKKMKPFMLY